MGGGCAASTAQGSSPLEPLLLLKLMTLGENPPCIFHKNMVS